MLVDLNNKLIIAISSRALFDLDASHQVYEKKGLDAYADYQIKNEHNLLTPGAAFHLVKKLLSICNPKTEETLVEVILLSRNSADTSLRIFNSIEHHNLNIVRAAFTNGESPYQYISAFNANLFLSANPDDVQQALQSGCAAAMILDSHSNSDSSDQLRIAFDGDSVLFSDEAERIYQESGLQAFSESEKAQAKKPLEGGPLKDFLAALHNVQKRFPPENCPIRTALVTARSAPAHERVIHTFRAWNIRIDESLFLGGLDKAAFLHAFKADFYFDDQLRHCDSTKMRVATAHVPHGVINE